MDILEETIYNESKTVVANIYFDEMAMEFSPRKEYDHAGTMLCWHKGYDLGDEYVNVGEYDPETFIEEYFDGDVPPIILPLYLFDHSGLSMSTSAASFRMFDSHGWDWGMVGIIYMTQEVLDKEFNGDEENGRSCLVAEVQEYDMYLTGDVHFVVVESLVPTIDIGESVGMIYGYDSARSEAESMMNFIYQAMCNINPLVAIYRKD